jgi:hypothetical protein
VEVSYTEISLINGVAMDSGESRNPIAETFPRLFFSRYIPTLLRQEPLPQSGGLEAYGLRSGHEHEHEH